MVFPWHRYDDDYTGAYEKKPKSKESTRKKSEPKAKKPGKSKKR